MTLDSPTIELTIPIPLPLWVRSQATTSVAASAGLPSTVALKRDPGFGMFCVPSIPLYRDASASLSSGVIP